MFFVGSIDAANIHRVVRGPFADLHICADMAEAYWETEAQPGEEVFVVSQKDVFWQHIQDDN